MVPANFSFHFQGQGQRSKVKALDYRGPMIISWIVVDIQWIFGPNLVITWVNTLQHFLVPFPNDLDIPAWKVKVI